MNFTEEQEKIIAAGRGTKASILINALAGAAKTTTLVALAHKLPIVPTFCGAFNKRIATEIAKRMPSHIHVATMNAVGHGVWTRRIGRRLLLENDKCYQILSHRMETSVGLDKADLGERFSSLLRATALAKSAGYVPKNFASFGTSLLTREEFRETIAPHLDANPDDDFLSILDEVLELSIAQGFEGKIDFNDQIYLSTLFGGDYPRYPILLIDEAQDLSPLNHAALDKMYSGRIIAVGDPFQAIYGFRGAHQSSMESLRERFNMGSMSLSTSFRCPRSVIRRQQERVPNMTWPEWAEEGKVEVLAEWSAADIPDGAAIICRNNAPLFSCALRLIRAGRGVRLVGSDLSKTLIGLLEKLPGNNNTPQETMLRAVQDWEVEQLRKAVKSRHAAIVDRAECLRVFVNAGQTKSEAIAFARFVFSAAGPIQLLTGHKAKGEEYDIVYFLEPRMIPSRWAREAASEGDFTQMEQELNLRYVIETRTKKELYFIELEDMTA